MLSIVKVGFTDYIDFGFFLNQTGREMTTVAFELELELFLVRKFSTDAENKKYLFTV